MMEQKKAKKSMEGGGGYIGDIIIDNLSFIIISCRKSG